MRKPDFCICENKDADQLCGNREADQRLCFPYTDSKTPYYLNPKFQDSSHLLWSLIQPALCGTWSETPKTGVSQNEAQLMFFFSRCFMSYFVFYC